jgi:hypothetical protein
LRDIDADLKVVSGVLAQPKKAAHERHKLFTTLERALTEAHGDAKTKIKQRVGAWVTEERRKAQEIQAKLQREADERARKEREALEKKAASMKTEAKREEYMEKAAEVQSASVHVQAPKADGVRLSERWKATVTDKAAFLRHVSESPDEWEGIVAISENRLAAAKTRFPPMTVPGVAFRRETS